MTRTARKKIGRPATGRDPAYSFRLPSELIEAVEKAAMEMDRSQSKVVREAIYLGLAVIHGEKPQRGMYLPPGLRPKHAAEIHEAGHAVAVFFAAEELDFPPAEMLIRVKLRNRGGVCYHFPLPAKQELAVTVAGAVAQAKAESKTFDEVWSGRGCGSDRRKAARLGHGHDLYTAIEKVTKRFFDDRIWNALCELARHLPNNGHMSGIECWETYKLARDYPD
jgi:hypothetical protein